MTDTAEEILQRALQLPEADRELLADYLWRSVDHPDRQSLEEAWADEADRRFTEISDGTVQATPWEQVAQELRSRRLR